jgi:hypothetical protein
MINDIRIKIGWKGRVLKCLTFYVIHNLTACITINTSRKDLYWVISAFENGTKLNELEKNEINKTNSEVGTKMEMIRVGVHGLNFALAIFNFQLYNTGVG